MRKPEPKPAPKRRVERSHKLEKFPIETLKEEDGFVLVYGDDPGVPADWSNGKSPYCLARRNGKFIQPMYTSMGGYVGAKWWRPVPPL